MFNSIKRIWKPEVYHGFAKKDNFFEGWYFKMVDKAGANILAIIPGIFKSKDKSKEHSFIQVLNGITHQSWYCRYDTGQFSADMDTFHIKIGDSEFSRAQINLNIDNKDLKLSGELSFKDTKPWDITLFSPGIMGWYGFVPFMECNHGVLSLDHKIEGSLALNNELMDFTGGRGYIEKDWGSSFPSSYVWLQSNNFEIDGISLTGSVAKIPWLGSSFRGCIFGLLYDNKIYRFTTYTGAKLEKLYIYDDRAEIIVSDKKYMIEISAKRSQTGIIHGPYEKQMLERVSESLDCDIELKFSAKEGKNDILIFSGTGKNSGLEINGEIKEIADNIL